MPLYLKGSNILTAAGGGGAFISSGSVADWLARSTAPGVIAAYGFDSSAAVSAGYFAGDNGTRAHCDTSVATMPGGGSIRFDLLAGETGANIAGQFTNMSPPWMFNGSTFGQNSTFYVQYRYFLSATMVSNLSQWDSFWKTSIFHQGTSTCAAMELTVTDDFGAGPVLYTDCGADTFYTLTTSPTETQSPPMLTSQGWDLTTGPSWTNEPNSLVNAYPARFQWPTNEWLTVYFKIHVGTLTNNFSVADSTLEVWLQRQGEAFWRKWVSCQGALAYDSSSSDVYNNMTLTPYMTALSTSASADAHVWYDELIISTLPIAIPVAPNS